MLSRNVSAILYMLYAMLMKIIKNEDDLIMVNIQPQDWLKIRGVRVSFPAPDSKSPDRKLGLFLFSAFGQVKVRCLVEYLFLWVFPQSPTSIDLLIY